MSQRKYVHKKKNNVFSSKILVVICLVGVTIPTFSIYLGYAIGNQYAPKKNIMPDRDVVVEATQLNMSLYNSHHVSIQFQGGLGAQMFQYAALYGIARANGMKPVISSDENSRSLINQIFPYLETAYKDAPHPGKYYPKFREFKSNAFDQRSFSLNYMKDIEIQGSFQSWRYFDHVRNEIRKQFSFSRKAIDVVQEFLHKAAMKLMFMKKDGESNQYSYEEFPLQFIGMHIRRGNILSEANYKQGYIPADRNYISTSMQYFKHKYKNVLFIVTSDDLDWCRSNLSLNEHLVVFSTYEHHGLDLCLLTQCNHTVMTVGAFGWWAAWLTGGESIYYRQFPRQESTLDEEFKRSDYYLSSWIAL